MQNTAVVFEGANFLGHKLVENLLLAGQNVIAVDSLPNAASLHWSDFIDNKSFKSLPSNETSVDLLTQTPVKSVFYMGAPVCLAAEKLFPVQILDANTKFTKLALDTAESARAAFITVAQKNTCSIPGITACRARLPHKIQNEANTFTEALARQARESRNINVKIARVYNCYGPGMNCCCDSPIPLFAAKAMGGSTLHVFNNGNDKASFSFVDDVASALALIPESNATLVINLANPFETSISHIAAEIIQFYNSGTIVNIQSNNINDENIQPDITHAVQFLNWKQQTLFDVGLRKTLQSFSQKLLCMGNNLK